MDEPQIELSARFIATLSLRAIGNLEGAGQHAVAMLTLAVSFLAKPVRPTNATKKFGKS